jgi:hypothetical protein
MTRQPAAAIAASSLPRLPAARGGGSGGSALRVCSMMGTAVSCGRSVVPWIAAALALILTTEVGAQVQISGLSDLQLGVWSGSGDLEGVVNHCVRGPQGGGSPSGLPARDQAARSCC